MRFSLVGSVVVHGVLVGAVVRLVPPPPPEPRIVTVELTAPKLTPPAPTPEPPAPEPKPPEPKAAEPPKTRLATRTPDKPSSVPESAPPQAAAPSVSAETPVAQPDSTSVLLPRRAPGVDLKLHSLPSGVVGGQLDGPPPKVAAAPAKEWRPRGSAGDPLLGKVDEQKDDPFPLVKQSDGWVYKGPAFNAKILLDGSVSFDDKNIRDFKGLSGSFDLTELIMKSKKQDPYRREKEKFLTHTTDMREKLLKRARDQRIAASIDSLRYELASVWRNDEKPHAERRATLYAMWKEAATTDKELADAGAEARVVVEQFIRKYLPQGSPNAFTAEEIDRFNAKGGKVRFDPYH